MANSASMHFYVGEKRGVRQGKFSKENPENIHSVFLELDKKPERIILGCLLYHHSFIYVLKLPDISFVG